MALAKDVNKLSYEECVEIMNSKKIKKDVALRTINTLRALQLFQSQIKSDDPKVLYMEIQSSTEENAFEITQKFTREILEIFDQIM